MQDDARAPERVAESIDDLTPDEVDRLGRVMARVLFAAWRATRDDVAGVASSEQTAAAR